MKSYIILGKYPVFEAIKNKIKILKIYLLEQNIKNIKNLSNIKYEIVDKRFFNKISNNNDYLHQGYAARIITEKKNIKQLYKSKRNVVLLDGLNDPRNQGSILRNCLAFNIYDVIIEKKFFNEESISMHLASSGASMRINIYETSNLNNLIKELKKNLYWIYGLDGSAKTDISKVNFQKNCNALIFGSEGYGLRNNVKQKCDELLSISINDEIDSLNVSNASAITLYEMYKKNRP